MTVIIMVTMTVTQMMVHDQNGGNDWMITIMMIRICRSHLYLGPRIFIHTVFELIQIQHNTILGEKIVFHRVESGSIRNFPGCSCFSP